MSIPVLLPWWPDAMEQAPPPVEDDTIPPGSVPDTDPGLPLDHDWLEEDEELA